MVISNMKPEIFKKSQFQKVGPILVRRAGLKFLVLLFAAIIALGPFSFDIKFGLPKIEIGVKHAFAADTIIVITSTASTTWTVPSDWNNSSNTVEVIGPGGNGANGGANAAPGGGGGGGGSYSKITNATFPISGSITIRVGAGGSGNSTYVSSTATVCAGSGSNASAGTGGTAGAVCAGSGSAGGAGGQGGPTTSGRGGGGGGGAAGPNGAGAIGGGGGAVNTSGGGGGGGNGGGSAGATSTSINGANGGNNSGASGGGTGGSGMGGNGSSGGGGAGGAGTTAGGGAFSGGTGSRGTEWSEAGSGGGGGGGGGNTRTTGSGNNGGNGSSTIANTGGGGGGGGSCGDAGCSGGTGASGADGVIVITYTPAAGDSSPPTPDPMTWASVPNDTGTSTINMSSTVGSDSTTPVEYRFTTISCTSNGGTGNTSSSWATSTLYTDSGLQANQCYAYNVQARDSVTPTPNTGTSSASSSAYTAAAVPGAPALSSPTTSTLTLANDANGNPASSPTTEFAVFVSSTSPTDSRWDGFWVNAARNGTSATAIWQADTSWDGAISNLTSSTTYTLKVKARNFSNEETALSSAGSGTTNAAPAGDTTPPTPASSTWDLSPAASTTVAIIMRITTSTDASSSPVSYLFTYSSSCSVDNGTGGTSSTWQSDSAYTDTGLDINKCYSYTAKARDSAGTPNVTTSTATSTAYTFANTPSAPSLSGATTSTIDLTNNQNGNPSNTSYAVQVTSTSPTDSNWNGKWVDSTGAATSTVVWMSDATLDTIVVKNLAANNAYTFTVKAKNGDSLETSQSATAAGTTVPNKPTMDAYGSVSSSTLTVNWTAPTGGADTYKVERSSDGNSFSEITSGVAGTSYNATATPNITWYFRVRGTNSSGDGPYSASSSQLMTPSEPGTPTYTNVSTSTLTVNWTSATNGADFWRIERATSALVYAEIATTTSNSRNETGLATSTTYYYKVRGNNATGNGPYSASSSVTTGGVSDNTPPTPSPSTWESIPYSSTTIAVIMSITTSTDATSPPVEYRFTYSSACLADNGTGGTSSTWQSGTTYTDIGLDVNKCYTYDAKARDSAGTPNVTTSTATSTAYTFANTPSAPSLSGATTSTIDLTNNQNGNPSNTSYAVQVTSTSPTDSNWNGKWVDSNGSSSPSAVWITNLSSITVINLQSNTTYTFTVKAKNGDSLQTAQGATAAGTTVVPPWAFYNNPSVSDGATIPSTVLTSSDAPESYIESNPTTLNPQAVPAGQEGEWDFALNPQNAASSTYYFRVVKSDGTAFDTYTKYAAIIVSPAGAGGGGNPPNAPTSTSPSNGAQDQPTATVFKLAATDPESDYLQYGLTIYSGAGCATAVQVNDQSASQTGWSGQNASSSNAYNSGSEATFTAQTALSQNSTYYWKASAKDPDGSNTWSSSSTCRSFVTTYGNWTTDSGDWSISSNQLVTTPGNGSSSRIRATGLTNLNLVVDVKAKISVSGANSGNFGPILRVSGTDRYQPAMLDALNALHKIDKNISNAQTTLTSVAQTIFSNTFYQLRGKVSGSDLLSWIDGANSRSTIDSALQSAGSFGLMASSTNGTVSSTFDNFAAYTSSTITLSNLPAGGSWALRDNIGNVFCTTGSTWDLAAYSRQIPIAYDAGGGSVAVWTGSTICDPVGSPTVVYATSTDIFGGDIYSYNAAGTGGVDIIIASTSITISPTGLISF